MAGTSRFSEQDKNPIINKIKPTEMDKTININIAGSMFSIDEEAYKILRDYLQALDLRFRNVKGGAETIEDIESRIAELFLSMKANAGVISRENVESMISVIGKPEDFDSSDQNTEYEETSYQGSKKRLYRNPDDTIIAGVCGGIGAYLNTDPVLIRILFVFFTAFFAAGFFLYIILWIALPPADRDSRKREMYGSEYARIMAMQRETAGSGSNRTRYNNGYYQTSRLGNAINEVFRALGRVLYVIMRVFLIFIGAVLLLTGFMTLLTFILIFVAKMPGAFSSDAMDFNIIYLPDFLNYMVSPQVYPWIMILAVIAVILPVAAMIYWGIKMIFWFKANDGILSLTLLVVWVLSLTTLAILFFNEGVSFAENSRSSVSIPIESKTDTCYVLTDKRVSDLINEKTLPFCTEDYSVLINDESKELYITPHLDIRDADGETPALTVRKESYGSSEITAFKKTDEILYNYKIQGDSVVLDDYFKIPAGRKWAADNVRLTLNLKTGTFVKIDPGTERLLDINRHCDDDNNWFPLEKRDGLSTWIVTEEGLSPVR